MDLILCSVLFDLKVRVWFGLGHAVLEGSSQDRKLLVGLEASERLPGLLEARGGPPEGHLRVAPSLDVAGDGPHRADGVLDRIGAGQRSLRLVR